MKVEKRKNLKTEVCSFLKKIPKGKVSTYKKVAESIGYPKAYRAVGNALNKNSDPVKYPCYKIVKSSGLIGGYALGSLKKVELLKRDGIEIKNGKVVNLDRYLFNR